MTGSMRHLAVGKGSAWDAACSSVEGRSRILQKIYINAQSGSVCVIEQKPKPIFRPLFGRESAIKFPLAVSPNMSFLT